MSAFLLHDRLESEILNSVEALKVIVMDHILVGFHVGFDPGNCYFEVSALTKSDEFNTNFPSYKKWSVGDWEFYNFAKNFEDDRVCDWPCFDDVEEWMVDLVDDVGMEAAVDIFFVETKKILCSEKVIDKLQGSFYLDPEFELCVEYYQGSKDVFSITQ